MISFNCSADLSVMGRGGSFDKRDEVTVWGMQWAEFFGKKPGIHQAWVAQADEKGNLHWISSFPAKISQPPFPKNILQTALMNGKVCVFQIPNNDKAGAIFPLEYAGKVVGMIGLSSNRTEAFSPDIVDYINSLSSIIIDGLLQAERRDRELLAETSINRLLQSSLDVKNILPSILEILSNFLQADAVLVSSYNLSNRNLELLASLGWTEPSTLRQEPLPTGIEFIKNKSSICIEDLQALHKQQPIHRIDKVGFRGYVAIPLIGHNESSGILEAAWKNPYQGQARELGFLERVAEQIAFVMERSAILQDLRQESQSMTLGYDALIEGLSRTLELRDFETEGHTRRVSQLTMRLVEHMKIPAEQWDFIRRGALLHDIGKLGVPDAILLKPGSLTDDERRMMEQHVIYGHTILTPIINSKQILDIVLHHHEHWDGAGYPDKLKGMQIPLAARLFAVVDVFDALTSDRPYRTAWTKAHALDFIKKQAGKQFDPLVVGYFLEIAKDIL